MRLFSTVAGLATAALIVTLTPAPAHAANFSFGPSTTKKIIVDQAYEEIRWSTPGRPYSEFEFCGISLENKKTRRSLGGDILDDYQNSGVLEVDDYAVEVSGGAGTHTLELDCSENGIATLTVSVLWRSRTSVTRQEGSGRVVTTTRRYSSFEGYVPARKATVLVERKVRGKWKTVGRRITNSKGTAVFAKPPTGRWRARTVESSTLSESIGRPRR